MNEIRALTGVRGFAACWVVLYHFRFMIDAAMPEWSVFRAFVYSGYLGVDLFAILSGFVISLSYAERLSQPSVRSTLHFLWLRLARIYPMLLFVLVVLIAVRLWQFGFRAAPDLVSDRSLWLQVAMLNGWGLEDRWTWNVPSWTVSSEWLCYLLFPFVAPLCVRVKDGGRAIGLAFTTLSATAVTMALLGHPHFDSFLEWGLVRIAGEFLTGCWLCQAYRAGFGRRFAWSWIGGVALASAIVCSRNFAVVTVFSFAALVYALSQGVRSLDRLFANRASMFLGEISYSVYLIHWVIVVDFNRIFDGALGQLSAGGRMGLLFGLVFVLATLTYFAVERPARKFMRARVGA